MEKLNLLNQLKAKSYLRFGRYWDYKWPLIGHISGGLLALAIGPFQFSKTFRNKFMTTHRWLGRIYLTAILIGTISATYLAWTGYSHRGQKKALQEAFTVFHGL